MQRSALFDVKDDWPSCAGTGAGMVSEVSSPSHNRDEAVVMGIEALREEFERKVTAAEKRGASFVGRDWYQYSQSEAEVFQIDAARWPRMIEAYDCYMHMKDIVDHAYDRSLLEAARLQFTSWEAVDGKPVMAIAEFVDFAASVCGLTHREANSVFYKSDWWNIRNGLVEFRDGQ